MLKDLLAKRLQSEMCGAKKSEAMMKTKMTETSTQLMAVQTRWFDQEEKWKQERERERERKRERELLWESERQDTKQRMDLLMAKGDEVLVHTGREQRRVCGVTQSKSDLGELCELSDDCTTTPFCDSCVWIASCDILST